ncbi:MAG: flippase-like domain-containing protein [Candidatus Dormibacteraeota bacterium]|nr:flippase-like domain-containing protein [Candidatus Dormibacteraeota bacterium]
MATAVLGLAATAGLVLILDPAQVGHAMTLFPLGFIPAIVALYLAIYALQGLRWHYLLRDAGARLKVSDSLLLNAAGQTITALVPLGDLTRAALASEASGREFGTLAATVTVQELTFNLMLVLCALPVMLEFGHGITLVVATLLTMAAITLILTVSPIFRVVHDLVAHIPLLNRLLPAIEELQAETASLLHTPDALWLSVLDLLRALVSIAAFWLVVEGFSPGVIDERKAAFVLAVSSIGGAISLIPGGVGANEASVAGLLIVFGVTDGPAGAAALIQRFLMTAMAIGLGLAAYAVVRRRFKLGGIFQLISRPQGETNAGRRAPG